MESKKVTFRFNFKICQIEINYWARLSSLIYVQANAIGGEFSQLAFFKGRQETLNLPIKVKTY